MAQNYYPEYADEDYTIPSANYSTIEHYPNLAKSMQQQFAGAKDFRDKIPQRTKEMYGQFAGETKKNLASRIKDTNRSFNRRGLLRSGVRQGAVYGAQGDARKELAGAPDTIAKSLSTQANQMDQNALNTAYGIAGMGPSLGSAYTSGLSNDLAGQMAEMQLKQQLYGDVAGAGSEWLGTGAAGLLGKKK